jgi:hypothetical protein
MSRYRRSDSNRHIGRRQGGKTDNARLLASDARRLSAFQHTNFGFRCDDFGFGCGESGVEFGQACSGVIAVDIDHDVDVPFSLYTSKLPAPDNETVTAFGTGGCPGVEFKLAANGNSPSGQNSKHGCRGQHSARERTPAKWHDTIATSAPFASRYLMVDLRARRSLPRNRADGQSLIRNSIRSTRSLLLPSNSSTQDCNVPPPRPPDKRRKDCPPCRVPAGPSPMEHWPSRCGLTQAASELLQIQSAPRRPRPLTRPTSLALPPGNVSPDGG